MLLRALFGWLARHVVLFAIILAVMVIHAQFVVDPGTRKRLDTAIANHRAALAVLRPEADRLRAQAVTRLDLSPCNAGAAINQRLAALSRQRSGLVARQPRGLDRLRRPRDAIIAGTRAELRLAVVDQEIAYLRQLQALVPARDSLDARIRVRCARIAALDRAIAADEANIRALPGRLSPWRYTPDLRDLADEYRARQREREGQRARLAAELADLQAQRRQTPIPPVAAAAIEAPLARLQTDLESQQAQLVSAGERAARHWYARLGIGERLWPAFLLLLGIILTPYAIRALFYWVLAPLAALRRPLLLLDNPVPIAVPAAPSSVSKPIALGPDQELLVRQGFLQSLAPGDRAATQWLLDARRPFTSLASGLAFLTRIRGPAADAVTLSAIRDPLAEIAVLSLPDGAAVVLQPRAIAGVVQPMARPLRITSHWRLFSLNAWLTWQLRFLVFHGPAEIILSGRRGVRIEAATAGRSIGQDQLIGFSAGVAYASGRTETFIPYLLGREPLLKDRIAAGPGLLIAEEAPAAGRTGNRPPRGLEGLLDALLKPLGI